MARTELRSYAGLQTEFPFLKFTLDFICGSLIVEILSRLDIISVTEIYFDAKCSPPQPWKPFRARGRSRLYSEDEYIRESTSQAGGGRGI